MALKYIIRETDFKGYNDTKDAEELGQGFLADAVNCFCDGHIVKRNGYTIIGNDIGLDKACQGLKGVRFANGTKELIGVFNGLIYKWTGSGNWSALTGSYTLSETALVDIVVANNNVYFFDGTNTVPKYNGTTVSTVGAIPKGAYAEWFNNQLNVAGILNDPNALQSSVIGDPETFSGTTSSDLDINANDGDYITGLGILKNELIVYKVNRSFAVTGFGSDALTIADIQEKVTGTGTVSNRSIVNIGNHLIALTFQGDIPEFHKITRTVYGTIVDGGSISDDIQKTMGGLNKTLLNKCVGVFDGQYVWWAVCNGSSTTNNLVLTYDVINKGWTRHTGINASVIDIFAISTTKQEIYFGEATAVSQAYTMDSSTSDNGADIDFSVKTRRYGGDEPEIKKKYKRVSLTAEESGDYDITCDYSTDGFSFDNLGTINLLGTGSIFDNIVLDTSRLGETDINKASFNIPKSRDFYIQFQFTNSSDTSEINIRDWQLVLYKKRPMEITN